MPTHKTELIAAAIAPRNGALREDFISDSRTFDDLLAGAGAQGNDAFGRG